MAGSLNKATIIGNLGRDPEIRRNNNGDSIASLSIATSEQWRDKHSGEKKERTEWHRVTIFNSALAEIAETYLKKGMTVYLEGQLQTRKWTDQQGIERYTTEIVLPNFGGRLIMLGSSGSGGNRPPPPDNQDEYGHTRTRDSAAYDPYMQTPGMDPRGNPLPKQSFDLNDEIPF